MTTVFIGGSRRIARLNDVIRSRADNIVQKELRVVIGDANGSDKAMQTFLAEKNYQHVIVHCVGSHCRNNIGEWPIKHVMPPSGKRDFFYYASKDLQMAKEATCGFMLWDGRSRGTLNNIINLLKQDKKAVVYFAPDKSCHTLRSLDQVVDLIEKCDPVSREKFEKQFLLLSNSNLDQPLLKFA